MYRMVLVMKNMVSIIVPIYNAEKHLERCLRSLECQTYSEYEVLLIDDGSKDTSSNICKNYAKINAKFQYIYQDNGGVSKARNTGLRKARGEYITFVDADDWVESTYIEKMLSICEERKCEIVLCCRIVEDGKKSVVVRFDDVDYIKCENTKNFLPTANHLYGAVWGGVFSLSSIDDVRFDENIHFGEDMLFISEIIVKCKKIARINEALYHYWKDSQEDTLSKGEFSKKRLSNLEAYRKTAMIFKDSRAAYKVILGRYGDACSYFISRYYSNPEFKSKFYKSILLEYRRNYLYMVRTYKKNVKWKLYDLFLLLWPSALLYIKEKIDII